MIGVTILGNNSASPAHGRHPTAQIVRTDDYTFLVDCGEGTQMRMDDFKIRRSKINHIFISHLHGDHYFGLIGLINSFGLDQRTADLHIYAPKGLEEIINIQLNAPHLKLPYRLVFHELNDRATLYEDDKIHIASFETYHGIPCHGFLFREVRNKRKINIDQVMRYGVPRAFYHHLQQGEDYLRTDGTVIPNDDLTIPGTHEKSYAFCADTAYYEPICEAVKGADMIYHESTYLKDDEVKAKERFHSTTIQAATIAQKAGVKRLLLGHYSARYENILPFQKEASEIFENVTATVEGASYLA